MLRRYELTDQEWEQTAPLLPPEKTGKPGRPAKENRQMLNAMVWIARSGAPWRDLPERYGPWKSVYSRFRKWSDINYAVPILEQINIEGSHVLAGRGYDSNQLIDYIYDCEGEPAIPSRKGAKFERHCDWWLYNERHLVEKYFLKRKGFRRIATRYDKLAFTYLGFICLASILIWLK